MKVTDFNFTGVISLPSRRDRKDELEPKLKSLGFDYSFIDPFPVSELKEKGVFASKEKRSCNLTKLKFLEAAKDQNSEKSLMLEDDLAFHPEFEQRLANLSYPNHWAMIYLGGLHIEKPIKYMDGLVRVSRALDNHAVLFNLPYLDQIISILKREATPKKPASENDLKYGDVFLSLFHPQLPVYAALPNLIWQKKGYSDLAKREYSNYDRKGRQTFMSDKVEGFN